MSQEYINSSVSTPDHSCSKRSCSVKDKNLIISYQSLQDTISLDLKGHISQYKVQAAVLEGTHLSQGGKGEGSLIISPHLFQ